MHGIKTLSPMHLSSEKGPLNQAPLAKANERLVGSPLTHSGLCPEEGLNEGRECLNSPWQADFDDRGDLGVIPHHLSAMGMLFFMWSLVVACATGECLLVVTFVTSE